MLGAPHFGWFFAGAIYYLYSFGGRKRDFALALAATLASSLASPDGATPRLFISAVFALTIAWRPMQTALANPVLLFLGFISYPLYLLHENMLVAMIVKLGAAMPSLPSILMPILPMAVVIGFGFVFARYGEPIARQFVVSAVSIVRRRSLRTAAL